MSEIDFVVFVVEDKSKSKSVIEATSFLFKLVLIIANIVSISVPPNTTTKVSLLY
jgi:hypothetical protein